MRPVRTLFLTFLVASSCLWALAPPAVAAAVTTDGPKLPDAVVGASSVHVNGITYVIGGRLKDGAYSDKVIAYDAASGQVSHVATLPRAALDVGASTGRYSATAVALNNRIYIFGGAQLVEADLNGDGTAEKVPRSSTDIIRFDPASNSAQVLSAKIPSNGAWGMTSAVVEGRVYLFGGFTFDITNLGATGRHDRVLRFDPNGPSIEELDTKLSYAVQDAAAATLGNRVLVIGGLSDHSNETNPCPTYTYYNTTSQQEETRQIEVCLTKRIMSFDPTSGSEYVLGVAGEIPYRAQFISAAVVSNKAYIAGAYLSDGSAASSILEVSVNSAGTPLTRVIQPTLPKAAFGQGVATDGSTIIISGGRTGGDRDLTEDIVRLDPRPTPPWAPRAASAADIPGGGVRLTWEAPTYNGDAVITGYRVYRTELGGTEARLTETTALSFDDTTVRPGTEYVWRVTAVNSAGESTQSARITRASGTTTPGPVAEFSAFAANNEVHLRWQAPNETGGANITGYRVVRNSAIITSLPPDARDHIDRSAVNGETYLYQVVAYNVKGDGTPSPSVRVTPAEVPPAPPNVQTEVIAAGSGSAVRVTWFTPEAPVERFLVFRAATPGRTGTLIANISATTTTYIDNEVERGRTYFYTVASENSVGTSPPSTEAPVALVRKPGAPSDVAAIGLDGEVRVSWTPPADTGDAPSSALRYYVSRQGGGASRAIILKTDIEGTTFTDRAVTPGLEYTYTVTTLNPMPSDPSAPSTATAKAILNKPPTALLSILPPLTNAGDPVELDASQSDDIDGTIKTYLFDFGDGTDPVTTEQATVTHQYAINGTFTATVIVTDNRNDVSTPASAQVIVGEVITDRVENGLNSGRPPTGGGGRPNGDDRPGSTAPALPGPGPALVLVAVAALAVALRRRRDG